MSNVPTLQNPIASRIISMSQDVILKRGEVDFIDDIVSSTIIFHFGKDSISVTQTGSQIGSQTGSQTSDKVLNLIRQTPTLTRVKLAELLSVSPAAIQKAIDKLKKQGTLVRKGGDFGGHWEIINN